MARPPDRWPPLGKARGAVAALVLASVAATQVYVPDGDPTTGTASNVPLGAKGPLGSFQDLRTQIRVPAASLPAGGTTIDEISLAGVGDGTYSYSLLEVKLAHLAGSALTTTFDANLAGATVVLRATNTNVAMQANQWSPLGLTGSFRHDGVRDLVVDIVIQGAVFSGATPGSRRSSTLETVFAPGYSAANPTPDGAGPFLSGAKLCLGTGGGSNVVIVGSGCPKGNGSPLLAGWSGSASIGSTLQVQASAAVPNTLLQLLVGNDDRTFGPWPLPFDLAPLGAGGCLLRTDVDLSVALRADASGVASLAIGIPIDPTLQGQRVQFQWLAPDASANALGVVISAMVQATLQ